jgi:hypothetical protein
MQQNCEQLNFAANIVPIVLSTILLASSRYDERNKILFWSILDVKGSLLGLILYYALTSGLTKSELIGIDLSTRFMVLIGCLRYEYMNYPFIFFSLSLFYSGLRRSVLCIFNALRARRFVRKHQLLLDRAATHGGIGIHLPNRHKKGIPNGCGFDFPILSLILTVGLISLIWWTRQYD